MKNSLCFVFVNSKIDFLKDQLIAGTMNSSQKVDNLLLLDNRYLKQLDNSIAGFLTTVN